MSAPNKNASFTTAQQEMWRARIRTEHKSNNDWDRTWGFLLESNAVKESPLRGHEASMIQSRLSNPQEIRDDVKVSD